MKRIIQFSKFFFLLIFITSCSNDDNENTSNSTQQSLLGKWQPIIMNTDSYTASTNTTQQNTLIYSDVFGVQNQTCKDYIEFKDNFTVKYISYNTANCTIIADVDGTYQLSDNKITINIPSSEIDPNFPSHIKLFINFASNYGKPGTIIKLENNELIIKGDKLSPVDTGNTNSNPNNWLQITGNLNKIQ